MLSVPHESLAGFAGDSPQSLRGRTIELVLDILTESARRTPMLLAIEDLLWADASTLELIGQVMNRGPIPGLCLLFTARPDFDAEWMRRSFVVAIDMKPLNRRRARALIEQTAGIHQLPTELCDRIIEETGGIPLYVQELTRAVLESGQWQQHVSDGGEFDLARLKIPANLQESIAARLDNLGPAKPVMQLCSVLGREFSYDLLRDASGTENETALREALDTIVEAELLFQHGMANHRSYIFKHVFIQEVAYDTLLKTQRRQLHARVAEMLEQKETESAQERALWLAHHHTEAGNVAQAVHNWLLASGESLNEFANIEAAAQARRGIELLEAQPPSAERSAMIIPLQTTLGTALLAMFGYAHDDVRAAFSRALALCEDIGDSPETFRVLVGMWMYYFVAGNFDEAQKLGDRMLGISTASGEPGQDMQARYCVALVQFYRGQFDAARGHFQAAIDNERADCDYAAQSPTRDDNRIHSRSMLGLAQWHLGRAGAALGMVLDARELAQGTQHPLGILFATFLGSWFHQVRNDPAQTAAWAADGAQIARDKGFPFWEALCGFMLAWAQGCANRKSTNPDAAVAAQSLAHMQESLAGYSMTGSRAGITWLHACVSEACLDEGQWQQAAEQLQVARTVMQQTGEVAFEPEILRLEARTNWMQHGGGSDPAHRQQAINLLQQALDKATAMGARAQALRVALDLAETAPGTDSLDQLREILATFEETDDSCYFEQARRLLKIP
jgi:tetratricopeptide (TPR) repeat protein